MTETMTRSTVGARLAALDAEEALISSRRRSLHRSIDALSLSSPLTDRQITELDLLEQREQAITLRRRELHNERAQLLAELSRAPVRHALAFSR